MGKNGCGSGLEVGGGGVFGGGVGRERGFRGEMVLGGVGNGTVWLERGLCYGVEEAILG